MIKTTLITLAVSFLGSAVYADGIADGIRFENSNNFACSGVYFKDGVHRSSLTIFDSKDFQLIETVEHEHYSSYYKEIKQKQTKIFKTDFIQITDHNGKPTKTERLIVLVRPEFGPFNDSINVYKEVFNEYSSYIIESDMTNCEIVN